MGGPPIGRVRQRRRDGCAGEASDGVVKMTEMNGSPDGASRGGDGAEPLLKLRGIDKHFGPVQALYGVDLDLPRAR